MSWKMCTSLAVRILEEKDPWDIQATNGKTKTEDKEREETGKQDKQ